MSLKENSPLLIGLIVVVILQVVLTGIFFIFLKNQRNDKVLNEHLSQLALQQQANSGVATNAAVNESSNTVNGVDVFKSEDVNYFKEYSVFTNAELEGIAINPQNADGHFLVLTLGLEYKQSDKKLPEELGLKMVLLKSRLIDYLSSKDLSYYDDIKNREALKINLKDLINSLLNNGKINRVLISQYVIQ